MPCKRAGLAAYRAHGRAGLQSKYSSYDARFKLRVLQHMQRDELSLREVSALYDIRDAGSVARWARLYDEGGINALTPRPRGRPRKMVTSLPPKPTEAGTPDERSREELLKEGTFDPVLIAKGERRFTGFDDKIIAMYARGMSVREIQGFLLEMYGIEVSPDFISTVTDAVIDEVREWQQR
ncbi:helix-turn-helix domain-containing protein, partial [Burkholderia multivorans]|uniref:helix-turn-helix domain-containing protein n=1 Tax=Burkholderia multivorans TaxID=87883 RepID=UPI0031FDCF64